MIDADKFKSLADRGDWISLYAMLDDAHDSATSREDVASAVHWRIAALERQRRNSEALQFLKENAGAYSTRSLVQHKIARLLVSLGREQEALEELSNAPFDAEMESFYALAMDAKFFYVYLLARNDAPSIHDRLSEIPDDYQYLNRDGTILTKADIASIARR